MTRCSRIPRASIEAGATTTRCAAGIGGRLKHLLGAAWDVDPERYRRRRSFLGDQVGKSGSRSTRAKSPVCGKDASKWWEVVLYVNNPVENVTTVGQKFLISPIEATGACRVWHSITRSSRSTCRMRRRTERGFGSGGERGLARGTELLQRAAEFGPRSVTTNDVKCQPSSGGLSDTGQRMMCLREPRGAGELRLTGHSGFSAFLDRFSFTSILFNVR